MTSDNETGSGEAIATPSASDTTNPNLRLLTGHKVNGLNDALQIAVLDARGPGNANHDYEISLTGDNTKFPPCRIRFQNGPIKETGFNGLSNESLLEIVIDRMEGFQAGPYASDDNAEALEALRAARFALLRRTRERMARGVEGTHKA